MTYRDRLRNIIRNKAILQGEFGLASGKSSDTYVDIRVLAHDPHAIHLITLLFMMQLPSYVKVIGSTLSPGTTPIVGAMVKFSYDAPGSDYLYGFTVRNERKKHGRQKLIEGIDKKIKDVAIIEDVTTTGESLMNTVNLVEDQGLCVLKVLTVLNRGGYRVHDKFRAKGIDYYSIFNMEDIV